MSSLTISHSNFRTEEALKAFAYDVSERGIVYISYEKIRSVNHMHTSFVDLDNSVSEVMHSIIINLNYQKGLTLNNILKLSKGEYSTLLGRLSKIPNVRCLLPEKDKEAEGIPRKYILRIKDGQPEAAEEKKSSAIAKVN